jgi:hypothetical protein
VATVNILCSLYDAFCHSRPPSRDETHNQKAWHIFHLKQIAFAFALGCRCCCTKTILMIKVKWSRVLLVSVNGRATSTELSIIHQAKFGNQFKLVQRFPSKPETLRLSKRFSVLIESRAGHVEPLELIACPERILGLLKPQSQLKSCNRSST